MIKQHCKDAGLDPAHYSGHSLQKGGATCALIAGVPETMVKLQGDWFSNAYQRYLSFPMEQKMDVPRAVALAMKDQSFWTQCAPLAGLAAAALYTP